MEIYFSMNGINDSSQNLNAYYTTNSHISKPQHVVVQGPENIPHNYVYTDKEANEKLSVINQDIYVSTQKASVNKRKKKILGIF